MKKKVGLTIGDVRPQNIFLNSEGAIKLSNLYSWPKENNNFSKTFDNEQTYLAPEDL
jgi:serine/threonine protein kinase